MSKIFFNPWIGDNYQSGGIFKKKILVLGEAHICEAGCTMCGNPEDAEECGDFTHRTMELILRGETHRWTPTFRKFERSLVGETTDLEKSREIWHSVAFYNYLQKSMGEARTAPGWVDFRESEDAFFEVIDELQPDLIIVWGVTRMYDCLPGGERWRKGEEMIVDGKEIKNGYYRLSNGKEVRTLWVYHPSAGYSLERWNKVINMEL